MSQSADVDSAEGDTPLFSDVIFNCIKPLLHSHNLMFSAVICLSSFSSTSLRTAGMLAAEILSCSESFNGYPGSKHGRVRVHSFLSWSYLWRGCGPRSPLLALAARSSLLFNWYIRYSLTYCSSALTSDCFCCTHRQLLNRSLRLSAIVGRGHKCSVNSWFISKECSRTFCGQRQIITFLMLLAYLSVVRVDPRLASDCFWAFGPTVLCSLLFIGNLSLVVPITTKSRRYAPTLMPIFSFVQSFFQTPMQILRPFSHSNCSQTVPNIATDTEYQFGGQSRREVAIGVFETEWVNS